jgi:hypothetical protein
MMKRSIFVSIMSLVVIFCLFSNSITASTLVGYWNFDDGTAADLSGITPALNGTLQNGATIIDGTGRVKVLKPGTTGGGVLLGYDAKLFSAHSITVQYWHKRSASPGQSWGYVVGQNGSGPRHFNNLGGMIYYMSTSDGNDDPINISKTSDNNWHHVVATYDGTYIYGYVDGVLVQKKFRGGAINGGNNYWSIGRQWNGTATGSWATGNFCKDYIDDVAVWNGYAPPAVVLGLKNGTYTVFNAPIYEPDFFPQHYSDCDFDHNGFVNFLDYSLFSDKWLEDCTIVDCNGTNLNAGDNAVNAKDLAVFTEDWLYNQNTGPLMSIENLMGIPTFKINNQFTTAGVFSHNWPHPDYVPVKQFADTGTVIQDFGGSNLNEWWLRTNPDKWDYSTVDTRIGFLKRPNTGDPDVLLMPWVTITPPQWWLDNPANVNELEMADQGTGPSIIHEDGKKYPSLASPKWRADMKYALENYIDYLYGMGYMPNIAGFKLSDVGCGGENLWHYSWRQDPGGYGLRTKEAFRNWLRTKYNNDILSLRAAWNSSTVTFDTAEVPTYPQRKLYEGTSTFRKTSVSMNVIDFEVFWNELLVDTIDYFAGVIKKKTNNTKLVGAFYCYMYEWNGNPEDGHQALRKYNESKNLDFVWQTASYETRGYITGGDVLRGPGYSNVLHGKQWANSNDTATFVCGYLSDNDKIRLGYTDTLERNKRMFLRSAGFNICNGGFLQEFFALHDQWYCDQSVPTPPNPYILVDYAVEPLNFIYNNSKNYDRRSNSEVLVVSDEISCSYNTYKWDNPLLRSSLRTPQIDFVQMGTPNDQILLDDIALLPDPNQYKLIIFLNCWHMSNSQRALVDSLKGNGRTLVFCYAAGYFNQNVTSQTAMESMIGMTMTVVNYEPFITPRVYVKSDHPLGANIIAKGVTIFGPTSSVCGNIYVTDATTSRLGTESSSGDSYRYMAIKDMGTWKSIYCITAQMPAAAFREIARYAGVHIYNENNDTFYANKSYVCIHPNHAEGTQQSRTITFPFAVDIYDAETEGLPLQSNVTSYTRSYDGGETKVYRYVPVP